MMMSLPVHDGPPAAAIPGMQTAWASRARSRVEQTRRIGESSTGCDDSRQRSQDEHAHAANGIDGMIMDHHNGCTKNCAHVEGGWFVASHRYSGSRQRHGVRQLMMNAFFADVGRQMPKAEALRTSQLERMKDRPSRFGDAH